MYEKPELRRIGSMRELTLSGGEVVTDPLGSHDGPGCIGAPPTVTCFGPS